jgi:hypothetical protein
MLPPPPSSLNSGSPLAVASSSKYYEFEFGNPSSAPLPNTDKPEDQQKSLIPGLSDITKNLNIGK